MFLVFVVAVKENKDGRRENIVIVMCDATLATIFTPAFLWRTVGGEY